jgi:hypothetical protein
MFAVVRFSPNVRLDERPPRSDHRVAYQHICRICLEDDMIARLRRGADPFWDLDGAGVKRARTRRKVVGAFAFAIAIVATGLTAALWLQTLAPALHQLGIG